MKEQMRTVHEVSKLTGVSIRTLHYYDEIGLLKPSASTDAGYRMYDDTALERLQTIMLFRELEFPLKDIKRIIDSPNFDQDRALGDQIRILTLKRDHLNGLIEYAKKLRTKGEKQMSFKEFDRSEIEAYQKLAKETWGKTDAYKEYEKKSEKYTEVDQRRNAEGLMSIFDEFGNMKDRDPGSEKVQIQVKKLQDYITECYYDCSNKILAGLGKMYVSGGEMTANIDVAGGKGCAAFVAKAIEIYVNR